MCVCIDDTKNITILSASSKDKSIKSTEKKNKTELSKVVAENLAKKAIQKKNFRSDIIDIDGNYLAKTVLTNNVGINPNQENDKKKLFVKYCLQKNYYGSI